MSEIDDYLKRLKAACVDLDHGSGLAPQPEASLDEELSWMGTLNEAYRELFTQLDDALARESAALERIADLEGRIDSVIELLTTSRHQSHEALAILLALKDLEDVPGDSHKREG